jgi:hypothetical protein
MADLGHESPARTERPDSVTESPRDKIKRSYYALKTLGPINPDHNRRTIYYGFDRVVAVFNAGFGSDVQPWTEAHDRELNACLLALNSLKPQSQPTVTESGGKEQPNSRDTNPSTDGTNG